MRRLRSLMQPCIWLVCCLIAQFVAATKLPAAAIQGTACFKEENCEVEVFEGGFVRAGRESCVIDARGGDGSASVHTETSPNNNSNHQTLSRTWSASSSTSASKARTRRSSFGSRSRQSYPSKSPRVDMIARGMDWWRTSVGENVKNWPKLQIRVEPTTTIKIRKTFYPLKTIVRLGAEFNTQLGVWQFKSSWEDAIIGSKLTLKGRELQLSKSWQLSVGAVEDLVTRLRFRAAVDLGTMKAYARVGFRTERLSPINVAEGFTIIKRLPLVGKNGKAKLEVKANFALPEPEIEYSTEGNRSMVGMGDIEVSIEELNLLLDY